MKGYMYLVLSFLVLALTIGVAMVVDNVLVTNAILLAFIISWIAFIPAYIFQTEKFYDLTGTIKYLTLVWFVYFSSNSLGVFNIGSFILAILISIWTIRLGSFLFLRIHKDGEDKRFRTIKISPSQFFFAWTTSGMWVSLCSMCALTAISSSSGVIMNTTTYIGILIFMFGFIFEVIADRQKTIFRSNRDNKDKFITSGLWSISRHPNYFGEVMLWLGISVISFSSLNGSEYISLISPIFTYLLLVYVSGVRMLEDRSDKKWGDSEDYIKYKKNTPIFFPKF
tara:strand:+ start:17411 stop:18256 length:846 start_codon:yes stop_codon:yes gene_type:complete